MLLEPQLNQLFLQNSGEVGVLRAHFRRVAGGEGFESLQSRLFGETAEHPTDVGIQCLVDVTCGAEILKGEREKRSKVDIQLD